MTFFAFGLVLGALLMLVGIATYLRAARAPRNLRSFPARDVIAAFRSGR